MTKLEINEIEINALMSLINNANVKVQDGAALYSLAQKIQTSLKQEQADKLKTDIKTAITKDTTFRDELQQHIDGTVKKKN